MKDSVERSAEGAEKTQRFRRGAVLVAAALLPGAVGMLLKQYGASASPPAIAGLDRVSGTVVLTQEGTRARRRCRRARAARWRRRADCGGAHAHLATSKSSVQRE